MTFTIRPPAPASPPPSSSSSASDDDSLDSEGDTSILSTPHPSKRAQLSSSTSIITPGELITDDPQWMGGHGTTLSPPHSIHATLAGTLLHTNKLLSLHALSPRYTPSIGDLVIGRIALVETKRWRVDIASSLLAQLPLSAINLPGGILRKRTATDELAIRTFFREGELVVAEVQGLFGDGSAGLHTRSVRYGKLRNGMLVRARGVGRGRRHLWTVGTGRGGGEVDVVAGVNGWVWVCKHIVGEGEGEGRGGGGGEGLKRSEEGGGEGLYEARNEWIGRETRREIARLGGCVGALVEGGVRVDEEMVMRAYEASLEVGAEEGEGEEGVYLGGERGRRVVRMALEAVKG